MKLIIIYTLEIAFNVNPANLLIQFKAALNAKMFAKNAKKAILIIVLLAKMNLKHQIMELVVLLDVQPAILKINHNVLLAQ